jgi:hypothetical protein
VALFFWSTDDRSEGPGVISPRSEENENDEPNSPQRLPPVEIGETIIPFVLRGLLVSEAPDPGTKNVLSLQLLYAQRRFWVFSPLGLSFCRIGLPIAALTSLGSNLNG